jgi:PAS domain S-box-containing protein
MKKLFRSRVTRVPIIYGIFSVLWIIITDQINFVISTDPTKSTMISMAKGILFVTVSSLLIYFLLRFDEKQEASLNTELKVMQDSFSSLFDRNPLPIWMHDPHSGHFLAANQAACRLYGYTLEEFRELKFADVCDPGEYKNLTEDQARGTFYLQRTGPWQQVLHSGQKVHVEFFPIQIQYAGSDVTMMTVFDLSQQREIEEELKSIVSERDDYEAFSYSVSHDLRAPLRAITGFGGVLLEDYAAKLDKDGQHFVQGMMQASQEMNRMIDNLLILARLKRGSLRRVPVDLAELSREIISELKTQEPQRKVDFTAPAKALVTADAGLMKPLLTNLLENAWKYTGECNPARIEFGFTDEKGKVRVFFIKDNGLGFSPEEAQELFKPFHRSHAVGEYPGMGIGLSIVARIVAWHNGRVWAEGGKAGGAAFYFTLDENK